MENRYVFLVYQFLRNEIAETDLDELIKWLKKSDENRQEFVRLRNIYLSDLYKTNGEILQAKANDQWEKLSSEFNLTDEENLIKKKSKIVHLSQKKYWLRVAAVLIPVIVCAMVFWQLKKNSQHKKPQENIAVSNASNPVFSLQQKAVLTLSNGQTVVLDSVHNKIIANDANVQLLNNNGAIIYKPNLKEETNIAYNTISTTKGGQYKLVLADGTGVWLNTLSSITYPVVFQGNERVVKLTGEAYFEVAKNEKIPFKVVTNNQIIEVLGTHFNVNSYSNETLMNTTLIEGKVKVQTDKETLVLMPGQQSKVNATGNIYKENNPDIEQVLAWRTGILAFNNSSITDIVRQLERWFDIEIKANGNFSSRRFSGNIPRTISLNELQRLFEVNNIFCSVQNNTSHQTLIISPLK